jgi:hypothetical protein
MAVDNDPFQQADQAGSPKRRGRTEPRRPQLILRALGTAKSTVELQMELIFILIALVPVTYLFINRDALFQSRAGGAQIVYACIWGIVYGVLLGLLFVPLGVLVGLAVALWAYLR